MKVYSDEGVGSRLPAVVAHDPGAVPAGRESAFAAPPQSALITETVPTRK